MLILGRLRDECLNAHWFTSLAHAWTVIEVWRREYNEERPTKALGSQRVIHCNVTAHPSATSTRQQLREAVGYENQYEYLIHDRDSIFSCDRGRRVDSR